MYYFGRRDSDVLMNSFEDFWLKQHLMQKNSIPGHGCSMVCDKEKLLYLHRLGLNPPFCDTF